MDRSRSAPYAVEYLPNLRRLEVYVRPWRARHGEDGGRRRPTSAVTVTARSVEANGAVVPLPPPSRLGAAPDAAAAAVNEARDGRGGDADGWVHVTVPLAAPSGDLAAGPALEQALDEQALPASCELDRGRLQGMWCRFCSRRIAGPPRGRALPLPSPHWQELTELWFCHAGQDIPLASATLVPRDGDWLLGEADVRLAAGSLDAGAAAVRDGMLRCSRCDSLLGTADGDEARVRKHAVSTGAASAFAAYTAENTASRALVAAVEGRAAYRFALVDRECGGTTTLLALLGWSGHLLDRGDGAGPTPCVKVRFSDAPAGWEPEPAVCVVEAGAEACAEVRAALEGSNALLPPARRAFGRDRVGFLRKVAF